MRFIVDCMLGKLARKLRMLGYDTLYYSHIEDSLIVWISKQENRILLTRDRSLAEKYNFCKIILLASQKIDLQIKELKKYLPELSPVHSFSRCINCNCLLIPKNKNDVKNIVFPYVFATQTVFAFCPDCQKIYWNATHVKNMEEELKRWFLN